MGAVIGDKNSGATDNGSAPVKIGGVYRSTKPTYSDGQRTELQVGTRGATWVEIAAPDQTSRADVRASADAITAAIVALGANGLGYVYNGASWDRLRTPNVIKTVAAVAITAGTGATIWTPTAGKKFRLMGWALSVSAGASLIFGDNAVATVILRSELLAAAGISQNPPGFGNGFLSAAANNVLKLDVTANATVSGFVFGTEE